MLAKRDHGARLRAFRALGTLSDETYLIAESELVEPAIRDAVAVEIDLVAIGAQDEALPAGYVARRRANLHAWCQRAWPERRKVSCDI